MELRHPLTRDEVREQAEAVDDLMSAMVDLRARSIACETGVPFEEVREAMHDGCEDRMREFAQQHYDLTANLSPADDLDNLCHCQDS